MSIFKKMLQNFSCKEKSQRKKNRVSFHLKKIVMILKNLNK